MATGVIQVVAGIIFNERLDLLVAQRAPGSHLAGMWEFPGGKIEAKESAEQALHREFEEEFNIFLKDLSFLGQSTHSYDTKNICLIAYTGFYSHGEIQAHVHSQFQWIHPTQLEKLNLAPADRPFISLILEFYKRISG